MKSNNKSTASTIKSEQSSTKSQMYSSSREVIGMNNPATTSKTQKSQFNYSKKCNNPTNQHQPAMPVINAPTSLTNLAQLSGITLLPVGKAGSTNYHKQQSNLMGTGSPSYIISNFNNVAMTQQQKRTATTTGRTVTNLHQTYNPSSIPSIQLLNQTSSSSAESVQNWRNSIANQCKASSSTTKQTGLISSINQQSKANRGSLQNNCSSNSSQGDIQLLPVTMSSPKFAESYEQQQAKYSSGNYEDILVQSSLESTIDESCIDVNGDSNNISLVKLMAILNNPALTITAVSSVPSCKKPGTGSDSTGMNKQQQQPQQTRIINATNLLDINNTVSVNTVRSHQSSKGEYRHENLPRIEQRIPTSAALLQSMSEGNIDLLSSSFKCDVPSHTTKSRNQKNSANLSYTLDPKPSDSTSQSDDQHSWSYVQNFQASTTCNKQAPVSWSSGSTTPLNKEESGFQLEDRINDSTMLSTSVRNLMMQQLPSGNNRSSVSAQLLKHIANQAEDNDWTISNETAPEKTILEPECVVDISRNIKQISKGAMRVENLPTVTTSCIPTKIPRKPLQTTKNRLYIPRGTGSVNKKAMSTCAKFSLSNISIEANQEREVFVSEKHLMLDMMMPKDDKTKLKSASEPDDIFINRSKRIMSKIDTMIERKKRRRFERISGREAKKTSSLEEQCAESEQEWSSDDESKVDLSSFIETQLPLEEIETEEKRNHLSCLGLVSRSHRNKLEVEQCEERMKIFSPLALGQPQETSSDVRRFVETIVKTGGTNVQLRIESNIKRNDLPLIEGLNRNTSRLKMSYMNVLGLEKRSKRTTLYKVRTNDNLNVSPTKGVNLNTKAKNLTDPEETKTPALVLKHTNSETKQVASNSNPPITNKKLLINCREALKPPNKTEYMKSLGLMAS